MTFLCMRLQLVRCRKEVAWYHRGRQDGGVIGACAEASARPPISPREGAVHEGVPDGSRRPAVPRAAQIRDNRAVQSRTLLRFGSLVFSSTVVVSNWFVGMFSALPGVIPPGGVTTSSLATSQRLTPQLLNAHHTCFVRLSCSQLVSIFPTDVEGLRLRAFTVLFGRLLSLETALSTVLPLFTAEDQVQMYKQLGWLNLFNPGTLKT